MWGLVWGLLLGAWGLENFVIDRHWDIQASFYIFIKRLFNVFNSISFSFNNCSFDLCFLNVFIFLNYFCLAVDFQALVMILHLKLVFLEYWHSHHFLVLLCWKSRLSEGICRRCHHLFDIFQVFLIIYGDFWVLMLLILLLGRVVNVWIVI